MSLSHLVFLSFLNNSFRRLSQKSSESGAYYHEKFLRTRADLCQEILRAKEKDMRALKASQEEPDFTAMSPMPPITDEDIGKTENILMEQKTGTKEGQEMNAMVVDSLSLQKPKEDPLADWLKTVAMTGVTSNDSWMEPRPIPSMMNMQQQSQQQSQPFALEDVPMQDCFALPKPGPMALPSFLTSPNACNPMGNVQLSMHPPMMNQPPMTNQQPMMNQQSINNACTPNQHELLRKVSDVSENMS